MAEALHRTPVFVALTRPQMFAGVTWSFFIANIVLAAELFLIFKSPLVLGVAGVAHLIGVILCINEPRFFDLWFTRIGRTPRLPNHAIWGCNSYLP